MGKMKNLAVELSECNQLHDVGEFSPTELRMLTDIDVMINNLTEFFGPYNSTANKSLALNKELLFTAMISINNITNMDNNT